MCHELPHEVGDFAMLLKAGMSVKQAVCYNILRYVIFKKHKYLGLEYFIENITQKICLFICSSVCRNKAEMTFKQSSQAFSKIFFLSQ